MFEGLPQGDQEPNGHGNHQEASGEQLLLERQRGHAGLQHNVHQLLHLQQGTTGVMVPMTCCCSQGCDRFVCLCVQPTDDIVLMAQALEKIFLQKVAQMPQEEVALLPPAPKGKNKSKQPAATTGKY